ncbi:hypothetical protein MtrunA17_Chr7g0243091 [Medicago truncatula]|uniref:Transmembrane protein n=1 Tax=Medicago truncatula TaxID=3880 RepID=A0A396GZT6_MEDTR|nr:hypothetical protein MtrunA17_Chr7g0243091 [Medicago truncatula]
MWLVAIGFFLCLALGGCLIDVSFLISWISLIILPLVGSGTVRSLIGYSKS